MQIDPYLKTHHMGVGCDNCGSKNFPGIRYKCTVCKNYDLCEKCAAQLHLGDKKFHDHALLKIPYPYFDRSVIGSQFYGDHGIFCIKHVQDGRAAICGTCTTCGEFTGSLENKYCNDCSEKFYACAICGKSVFQ